MSATDELRKLLDERGVEWKDYGYDNHTWWSDDNNVGWHAENRPAVTGSYVKIEAVLTPEQAIAATLGSHERTTKMYRDEHGIWHCAACERGADVITGNDGELDSWIDSWAPNYCPYCGRRGE